jgi:hypothetical protein
MQTNKRAEAETSARGRDAALRRPVPRKPVTTLATRNPGAGQDFTGLAAAVQLRLRVALHFNHRSAHPSLPRMPTMPPLTGLGIESFTPVYKYAAPPVLAEPDPWQESSIAAMRPNATGIVSPFRRFDGTCTSRS